ncbi:MAG TPA: methylenetetrahydrofolate reductase, partial [Actinomycetota bacterium]|nr:methylenetetrahydrofolate reductase [Actinomycetota bacterium]
MAIRSGSRLEQLLHGGVFCVTAEVVPPRSADPDAVSSQARALVGYADAANVTDNPTSAAHMSPVAGAALVWGAGVEPVMQLTTRDRNRLGLTSDLLGGWALGARNVLCLTGDPPAVGDHPGAGGVYDLSVLELISLTTGLRTDGRLWSGAVIDDPPRFFVGVADVPLSDDYDFGRLEQKADRGADFVQTQIVFDVDAFGEWAERAKERGLLERMFVLAGVAVARGPRSARFMREHLPGVVVPDEVVDRLETAGSESQAEGVRITVEVLDRLRTIDGLAGVHVMGLGHLEPVQQVVRNAGLLPR